jgi:hypothetical protein
MITVFLKSTTRPPVGQSTVIQNLQEDMEHIGWAFRFHPAVPLSRVFVALPR